MGTERERGGAGRRSGRKETVDRGVDSREEGDSHQSVACGVKERGGKEEKVVPARERGSSGTW